MLLIVIIAVVISGCGFSGSFMRGRNMPEASVIGNAPMVFGGEYRDIYLGNISTDPTNADSIYNKKGKYGDPKSELSISNKKGEYGSVTSKFSACNSDAFTPPVIVDKYNMVLGTFTLNKAFHTTLPDDLIAKLRKLCN